MPTDTHRAIEAVWRIEAPRLIAGLTRLVRDLGVAEELAQDALVAALEQWPADGVPDNPGAWLMTTARRRAIDQIRRNETYRRKVAEVGRDLEEATPDIGTVVAEDDGIGDDLLRLVFVACHPVLSTEARAALTLRLLGGLTTDEIARAFLVPEPTVAQRIVRAKKTLAGARVPFEVPQGDELAARLSSVLEVVYLIFNEGYAATAGDDWMRPALCEEALRLGLVYKVYEDANFAGEVAAFAEKLARGPGLAYRLIREAVFASDGNDLDAQLALEAALQHKAGGSRDFQEGVAAFLEKRPPRFEGR